jgi:hypothetical protein
MHQGYSIDSDSDEDDVEAVAAIANSTTWHLHDIEKVPSSDKFDVESVNLTL